MTRNEAIQEIKSWDFLNKKETEAIETLVPELAEIEDERIRKFLIDVVSTMNWRVGWPEEKVKEEKVKCITWLEKQKELPTNEEMLRTLRTEYEKGVADTIAKYEQKEQKPAEWSEEDEKIRESLISLIETISEYYISDETRNGYVAWLKSLRPQPHTVSIKNANKFAELEYERGVKDGLNHHWKPSEEQMDALRVTLEYMPDTFKPRCTLMTLQNDLKKLM